MSTREYVQHQYKVFSKEQINQARRAEFLTNQRKEYQAAVTVWRDRNKPPPSYWDMSLHLMDALCVINKFSKVIEHPATEPTETNETSTDGQALELHGEEGSEAHHESNKEAGREEGP